MFRQVAEFFMEVKLKEEVIGCFNENLLFVFNYCLNFEEKIQKFKV